MKGCYLFQCFGPCTSNQQSSNKRAAKLSAKAFQSMSSEEQDEVYNDLYGYNEEESLIDEKTEFVQEKLEELGRELNVLDAQVLKYYLRAIQIEEEDLGSNGGGEQQYLTSDAFLLMFLRAEKFNCRLAARKLTVYFKEKFQLFGEEALARRIKLSDFTEEDMKTLLTGSFCFTGETDKAGRPIMLARRQYFLQQDVTSMMRVIFYLFQSALEDNEMAQKKGMVIVVYNMNAGFLMSSPSQIRSHLHLPRLITHAIPVWIASLHICYDDFREHVITNLVLVIHPEHSRARFQEHFHKTHEECLFGLAPYGIDLTTLLTDEGDFRHDMLLEYLQRQRKLEE